MFSSLYLLETSETSIFLMFLGVKNRKIEAFLIFFLGTAKWWGRRKIIWRQMADGIIDMRHSNVVEKKKNGLKTNG